MNYKTDTTKGTYNVINPDKYIGSKRPIYRSKWEWRVFDKLDRTPNVLKWGSECIEIYYHNPLQRRFSVYYPDIFCILMDSSGVEQKFLMEIKPAKMTMPPDEPKKPKTMTAQTGLRYKKSLERYQNSVMDYAINIAKWEAAQKWCLTHAVRWAIVTENNMSGMMG